MDGCGKCPHRDWILGLFASLSSAEDKNERACVPTLLCAFMACSRTAVHCKAELCNGRKRPLKARRVDFPFFNDIISNCNCLRRTTGST
jgi:hypothetical protein